jgi:hypothetical protein
MNGSSWCYPFITIIEGKPGLPYSECAVFLPTAIPSIIDENSD